jgi:hypothetical protein
MAHHLLKVPAEIRTHVYRIIFADLVLRPTRPSQLDLDDWPQLRVDLNILLTCRQTYAEAQPVLLQVAKVCLLDHEEHLALTKPGKLPILRRIRSLSIPGDLLLEWSPTLVRLVAPSLIRFEIRGLDSGLGHTDMLALQAVINAAAAPRTLPMIGPALDSFNKITMGMPLGKRESLRAHCDQDNILHQTLKLHFRAHCLHNGQIVIPGQVSSIL